MWYGAVDTPLSKLPAKTPSVSRGEGETPQGGPFSQHWVGMPGCTKTRCTSEMVLEWSPHGCCSGAGVAPLLAWRVDTGHIPSSLLVLAGATESRTSSSKELAANAAGAKRNGPEMKLPSLVHLSGNHVRKMQSSSGRTGPLWVYQWPMRQTFTDSGKTLHVLRVIPGRSRQIPAFPPQLSQVLAWAGISRHTELAYSERGHHQRDLREAGWSRLNGSIWNLRKETSGASRLLSCQQSGLYCFELFVKIFCSLMIWQLLQSNCQPMQGKK